MEVAHTLRSDSQKEKVEDLAPSPHQALPLGELVLLPQAPWLTPKGSLRTSSLFHVILSLGSAFFPGRIGACDFRGFRKTPDHCLFPQTLTVCCLIFHH